MKVKIMKKLIITSVLVIIGLISFQSVHAAIQGDINGDGIVNNDDWIIFQPWFGQACPNTNPTCDGADLNGDGVVNGTDFSILAQNFGQTAPVATSTPVIENTSVGFTDGGSGTCVPFDSNGKKADCEVYFETVIWPLLR